MKIQKCHIPNMEEASKSTLKQQGCPWYHEVWVSSMATCPNSCTARALRTHCARIAPSAPLDPRNWQPHASAGHKQWHRHTERNKRTARPPRTRFWFVFYAFWQIFRLVASRSQSAPHMHVLVCICNNVRQFITLIIMIHIGVPPDVCRQPFGLFCQHLSVCIVLYRLGAHRVTFLFTLRLLALLGQVRSDF